MSTKYKSFASQVSFTEKEKKAKFEKLAFFPKAHSREELFTLPEEHQADPASFPNFLTEEILSMPPLLLHSANSDAYWQEISRNLTKRNPTSSYFKRIFPKEDSTKNSRSPVELLDTISPTVMINKQIVAHLWESKKKALLEYARNKNSLREKFRVISLTARTINRVNKAHIKQRVLYRKRKSVEKDIMEEKNTEKCKGVSEKHKKTEKESVSDFFSLKNRRRKSADIGLFGFGKPEKLRGLPQVPNEKIERREGYCRDGSTSHSGLDTSLRLLSEKTRQEQDERRESSRRRSSRIVRIRKKTQVFVVMTHPKKTMIHCKNGLPIPMNSRNSLVGANRVHQDNMGHQEDQKERKSLGLEREKGTGESKKHQNKHELPEFITSIGASPLNEFKKESLELVPVTQNFSMQDVSDETEKIVAGSTGFIQKNYDFYSHQDLSMKEEEEDEEDDRNILKNPIKENTSVADGESIEEEELKHYQMIQEWEENKNIYLKHSVPSAKNSARYLKNANTYQEFWRMTGFGAELLRKKSGQTGSGGSRGSSFVKPNNTQSSFGFGHPTNSSNFVIKSTQNHQKAQNGWDLSESLIKKTSYFNLYSPKEKPKETGSLFHSKRTSLPYQSPLISFDRRSPNQGIPKKNSGENKTQIKKTKNKGSFKEKMKPGTGRDTKRVMGSLPKKSIFGSFA